MNTPKFKEGEWIKSIHNGRTARVVMLLKTCYSLWFPNDGSYYLDYSYQDNWELTDAPPKTKLEEAAEEYRRESYSKSVLPNIDGPMPEYGGSIKDAFIAGAEWQKSQMLKDAVEGEICGDIRSQEEEPFQIWAESAFLPLDGEFKLYDKVKLIIVKGD